MRGLRLFFLLLAMLSGGLAQASYSFDHASRASDEELDRMRGGFIVSWNGLEFLMPFSITGIERLTQIGSQTYINGELISPKLNPQALTPISQTNKISVSVQTQAPVVNEQVTPPVMSGQATPSVVNEQVTNPTGGAKVTTLGQLILIQAGKANVVALPPNVSLDSLATYIQNSVNNQVIRNLTTLNITLEAQKLAMQARLNAIQNQSLNGLH